MKLVLYTHKDLFELAKAIIKNATGVTYPFGKGTLHRAFVELSALFGAHSSSQVIRLIGGMVLEGLTDILLDRRGLEEGVSRADKAPARGQGAFVPLVVPAAADYTIPASTMVVRPATGTQSKISFQLEAAAVIQAGDAQSNTVSVVAMQSGTAANGLTSGTLLDLEYPIAGVSHLVLSSDTGGGLNRQTNAEYRSSIRDARKTFGEGSWAGVEALLRGVRLDSGVRVVISRVYENFMTGVVRAYIDDGSGDAAIIGPIDTTSYPWASMPGSGYWEFIPTGRDLYIHLPYSHLPIWNAGVSEDVRKYDGAVWSTLVHNTDYFVNENTGIIVLASPLVVGEIIRVWFRFYVGLVGEAASFVNGVVGSSTKKGWRSVGQEICIRAPDSVLRPAVSADLHFTPGHDSYYGRRLAQDGVLAYLDGLGIGEGANYGVINGILHKVVGVSHVTNLLVNGGGSDVSPTTTHGVIRGDSATIVM